MTAADFMMQYVRKKSWFAVASIFSDNGSTVQPHVARGFICASASAEMMFAPGKIDAENTPILESIYLVAPEDRIGFQQTISVFPFTYIQRFDTLTYTPIGLHKDEATKKLILPDDIDKAKIMGMTADEETKLYPDTDTLVMSSGEEESVYNLYPKYYEDMKYNGIRIAGYQEFQNNQKLFCEACNTFFGLSDCE